MAEYLGVKAGNGLWELDIAMDQQPGLSWEALEFAKEHPWSVNNSYPANDEQVEALWRLVTREGLTGRWESSPGGDGTYYILHPLPPRPGEVVLHAVLLVGGVSEETLVGDTKQRVCYGPVMVALGIPIQPVRAITFRPDQNDPPSLWRKITEADWRAT